MQVDKLNKGALAAGIICPECGKNIRGLDGFSYCLRCKEMLHVECSLRTGNPTEHYLDREIICSACIKDGEQVEYFHQLQ